jgi:hypothetical protein
MNQLENNNILLISFLVVSKLRACTKQITIITTTTTKTTTTKTTKTTRTISLEKATLSR